MSKDADGVCRNIVSEYRQEQDNNNSGLKLKFSIYSNFNPEVICTKKSVKWANNN